jgi:hypothetical protein
MSRSDPLFCGSAACQNRKFDPRAVYLQQPLEYVFHADDIGEDIHLWWDHPELTICLAKQIRIGHKKLVVLR